MPDIFLSYAREDQATARRFAEALQSAGYEVWWDQALHPGETFDQVTESALREARAVVVLWSRQSVLSRWVRSEATQADRFGTLVPVMIETCDRPIMFELSHTEELVDWRGDVTDPRWLAFMEHLRRFLDRGGTSSVEQLPVSATLPPPFSNAYVSGRAPRWRRARLLFLILLAVLVILGVGAWWYFMHGRSGSHGAAAAASGPVSLAVLPFVDLSAGHDQEYLSDGLTEEILNQLAQVPAMRVVGRTSSFSYKGRNVDLRDIATQLGVENLLEGSVRKEGDDVRISAQLINGRDGTQRWSHTYQGKVSAHFDLEIQVAHDVSQALSVTLDVADFRREEGGTTNAEAYDLYLKARKEGLEGSREAAMRSVPLLREAVKSDPEFALAWRDLATAIRGSAMGMSADQAKSAAQESAAAFARARSLAPGAWWAWLPDINDMLRQGRWAEVMARVQASRGDAPLSVANFEVEDVLRYQLLRSGRVGEAIRHLEQMIEVEPRSIGFSAELQIIALADRRFDDLAEQEYQRTLNLPGDHQRINYARFARLVASKSSTPEQINEQYQRILQSQNLPMKLLPSLAKVVNDRVAANALIRNALTEPENENITRIQVLALTADLYGDPDLTWEWLNRARGNFEAQNYILWLLPNSGVRADPRFKALIRELKLDQYWRQSGSWGDFCKPVGEDDFECH
jgi:TolB-like protein/tetratricopeptide (TPR) repeat protein